MRIKVRSEKTYTLKLTEDEVKLLLAVLPEDPTDVEILESLENVCGGRPAANAAIRRLIQIGQQIEDATR